MSTEQFGHHHLQSVFSQTNVKTCSENIICFVMNLYLLTNSQNDLNQHDHQQVVLEKKVKLC